MARNYLNSLGGFMLNANWSKLAILIMATFLLTSFTANADGIQPFTPPPPQLTPQEQEALHVARKACFTETGVQHPAKGSRLSPEDHMKIITCLNSKGVKQPIHGVRRRGGFGGGGRGRHRGKWNNNGGANSNGSSTPLGNGTPTDGSSNIPQ
jgi:hypothetical protein